MPSYMTNAGFFLWCFNGLFQPRERCGRYRMAGNCPLRAVDWPAFTSGAVPRSMSLTRANVPTMATKVAHNRPTTTIFNMGRVV